MVGILQEPMQSTETHGNPEKAPGGLSQAGKASKGFTLSTQCDSRSRCYLTNLLAVSRCNSKFLPALSRDAHLFSDFGAPGLKGNNPLRRQAKGLFEIFFQHKQDTDSQACRDLCTQAGRALFAFRSRSRRWLLTPTHTLA